VKYVSLPLKLADSWEWGGGRFARDFILKQNIHKDMTKKAQNTKTYTIIVRKR